VRTSLEANGRDAPQLGFEFAPCIAAVGDDVLVVSEDAVGEPVVTQELPEVFDEVEFGAARGKRQESDVVGNGGCACGMPTRLIKHQNGS
jgi:hypothetical protein